MARDTEFKTTRLYFAEETVYYKFSRQTVDWEKIQLLGKRKESVICNVQINFKRIRIGN